MNAFDLVHPLYSFFWLVSVSMSAAFFNEPCFKPKPSMASIKLASASSSVVYEYRLPVRMTKDSGIVTNILCPLSSAFI